MIHAMTADGYLQQVGAKTRNMIRKADKRGYVAGVFDYNDFLDDVYSVNTSKKFRAGRRMTKSYQERPWPVRVDNSCSSHRLVYVGVFKDGRLVAYAKVVIVGEVAVLDRFIGHGDNLRDGVMNLLLYAVVCYCVSVGVYWVNYLTMESASKGIEDFKRHAGFRATDVVWTS